MKSSILVSALVLAGVALVAAGSLVTASDPTAAGPKTAKSLASPSLARVYLEVEGMSCGGCVGTIEAALSEIDGISEIRVDAAAGRADVAYDPARLEDAGKIARAVSESGYPARIVRQRSPEQVRQDRMTRRARSTAAIAAVGGIDIPRADFETELGHAIGRYQSIYGPAIFADTRGNLLLDRLKGQIARQLVIEGIQLREIQRAGFAVDPTRVDLELEQFLEQRGLTRNELKSTLADGGMDVDYFQKKMENRALISAYLEEKVFSGATSDAEKQQRYGDWLANAKLLAEVVYYDRELAELVQNPSDGAGCGSACGR